MSQPTSKKSGTDTAIEGTDKAIAELSSVLDRVEGRLSPVLRAPGPMLAGTDKTPPTTDCAIAERIRSLSGGVDIARRRLAELLERLDV